MITYTFKDPGYFYVNFLEVVSCDDVMKYLQDFGKIEYLPADLLLLYNLQNVKLDFEVEEISEISKLASEVTAKYNSIKTALVVSNPNVTAYSIIFQSDTKHTKTKRKTFSSEDSAINWLINEEA